MCKPATPRNKGYIYNNAKKVTEQGRPVSQAGIKFRYCNTSSNLTPGSPDPRLATEHTGEHKEQ